MIVFNVLKGTTEIIDNILKIHFYHIKIINLDYKLYLSIYFKNKAFLNI